MNLEEMKLDEEEPDAVEFDTDEFAVSVELGEEIDEDVLGGSNEFRGDELDEEFNEGEEPIPCINESIVPIYDISSSYFI